MSRKRKLSPEERALWDRVAATTENYRPKKADRAELESFLAPKPKPKPKAEGLRSFELGQHAKPSSSRHDLAPEPGEHLARQPVTMDRKAHKAMTRGKLKPEGVLDLHGLTLAEAHPELIGGRACSRQTAQIVVIGQRKQGDAISRRAANQFCRREQPIRGTGMAMKVYDLH